MATAELNCVCLIALQFAELKDLKQWNFHLCLAFGSSFELCYFQFHFLLPDFIVVAYF